MKNSLKSWIKKLKIIGQKPIIQNCKIIISLLFFIFICSNKVVFAQTSVPSETEFIFSEEFIPNHTDIKDYTPLNSEDKQIAEDTNKGAAEFRTLVQKIIKYVQKILIPIAILFSIWAGVELLFSRGEEEELTTNKQHIYGLAIGFMIILLATVFVEKVFFGIYGGVLRGDVAGENFTEMAKRGVFEMRGIFNYFTTLAVITGIAFIIFTAIKMIVVGGEDEGMDSKLKKRIIYTMGGMAVLVSAEKITELFTHNDKIAVPNVRDSINFVVQWANFILGFVGISAIVILIWAGIRLIADMGQEDQAVEEAKQVAKAAIIGLALAFSAWTLIYFFLVP